MGSEMCIRDRSSARYPPSSRRIPLLWGLSCLWGGATPTEHLTEAIERAVTSVKRGTYRVHIKYCTSSTERSGHYRHRIKVCCRQTLLPALILAGPSASKQRTGLRTGERAPGQQSDPGAQVRSNRSAAAGTQARPDTPYLRPSTQIHRAGSEAQAMRPLRRRPGFRHEAVWGCA